MQTFPSNVLSFMQHEIRVVDSFKIKYDIGDILVKEKK